jgi:hypothetical protein
LSVDTILKQEFRRSREPALWTRTRVVGRPLRALAFGALGLVGVVATIALVIASSRGRSFPNVWTYASMTLLVPAGFALGIAIDEARRPVRIVGLHVFGSGARRGVGLRWHPRFGHVVDEYRQTTQLNEAQAPSVYLLLREALSPRVRTRVIFEDAPFHVGGTVQIRFVASLEKGEIDPAMARFHLRCFREDPDVVLPWRRGIECLADLAPGRRRDRTEKGFVADLEFRIPPGLPGADLAASKPSYWVFFAVIDGLDGPYCREFLVPVAAPSPPVTR